MKWSIIFLLLCRISMVSPAQSRPAPTPSHNQDHSQIKMLRMSEISNRFLTQKKDAARAEMYLFFSTYFTDNNIYPNEDAIDLIDAYNKAYTYDDIKSKPSVFKPLRISPVTIDAQHYTMMKQNERQIKIFKNASDTFSQRQQIVNALTDTSITAAFKNSLLRFSNITLPGINSNANYIPALQMDFFLTSLNDINRLMNQLQESGNRANTIIAIRELMDDFFAYDVNEVKNSFQSPSSLNYDNNRIFFTAAYRPANEKTLLLTDEADLPNADVYVYTRGADGKWDQQPKPEAFNVYYGANGLKYSLTPGCDTLSFFRYHPTKRASTLPIILAKGNYCFVLQDVTNNRIYLRPDINLRDNKVIDDQQLIALCFKVEN